MSNQPTVYKLPSPEILAHFGFQPEASLPTTDVSGFPGKQGSSKGIQIYPGYKGSKKLCIVLLPPFEYVICAPGPPPADTPIVKLKASTTEEFRQQLYAAGYPSPERKKELDKEYRAKQLEDWRKECEFIEFMNQGRVNKNPLPKEPSPNK